VLPRLVEAAQEQDGSRFLQAKLWDCEDDVRDQVFEKAVGAIKKLAEDPFGNWVVQKLIEKGSDDQRIAIAEELKGSIIDLAKQQYGCRVIQKVVQLLPHEAQGGFVEELRSDVLDMMVHKHGNHVIQKTVENMPPEGLDFIIDAVTAKADEMAAHTFGCRVIQRLVERCTTDQLSDLLDKMMEHVSRLSQDDHGNYVVQCVLLHGRGEDQQKIIQAIRPKLVDLAKKKVSSNVVEKCFGATVGPHAEFLEDEKEALFSTFMGEPGDTSSPLMQLMNDKFGNYTVQAVIKHSRGAHKEEMIRRIKACESQLQNSNTGKHILAALEKEQQS
jgi:pumilio RNA-binding family